MDPLAKTIPWHFSSSALLTSLSPLCLFYCRVRRSNAVFIGRPMYRAMCAMVHSFAIWSNYWFWAGKWTNEFGVYVQWWWFIVTPSILVIWALWFFLCTSPNCVMCCVWLVVRYHSECLNVLCSAQILIVCVCVLCCCDVLLTNFCLCFHYLFFCCVLFILRWR